MVVSVFRIEISAQHTVETEFPAGPAQAKTAKSAPGFCRQLDGHAFARGVHFQFSLLLRHEPARVLNHLVNPPVVVVRVVVEQ